MVRIALVGWSAKDWRLYRQPQWMAEVRRDPQASQHPRRHFDIEESAFHEALSRWESCEANIDETVALALLKELGAVAVVR